MKASAHTQYAAFVGIDRVDGKHDVCLQQAGCDTREFSVPPHRPEAPRLTAAPVGAKIFKSPSTAYLRA